MANTLKFGAGNWATKEGSTLAYNDENNNFKPLPFTFTRASNATVVNKAGLIETVGNGIPRIDFADSEDGALLLEPQRTNLVTSSNNLTSQWGGYSFSGGNMALNYGVLSPDGSNNATRLTYTNTSAGTGGALLTLNLTLVANAVYTISFWAKNVSGQKRIRLDLKNSSSAGVSGTSFELTDKWQKYSHTVTNDNATNRGVQIRIIDSEFIGNRVFDMWGVQLEQASYATSTIPTQGSAVTRLADDMPNHLNINPLNIGNSYTLFLDTDLNKVVNNKVFCEIENSASNRVFSIRINNGGKVRVYNALDTAYPTSSLESNTNKWAIRIDGNSYKIFGADSSLSGTLATARNIGEIKFYGIFADLKINNFNIYNTPLSDAECEALVN